MSRLTYKIDDRYEEIVTYDNAKYTDEQYERLKS